MFFRLLSHRLRAWPAVLGISALLAVAPTARAQTDYYWQAPNGGSGNWTTVVTNWSTSPTGPLNYAWTNSGTERANFGNAGGVVGLGSPAAPAVPMSAFGVNFSTSGYVITNGGLAANTLTLTGAGGVIDTGANVDAIAAVVAGSVGLTKNGTGTLFLTGANTYTGGTTLNNGVIAVVNGTALGGTATGTNVVSGAAVQVFNNGTSAVTVTQPITLSGTGISGTGALRNSTDQTQGLTNVWSGAITIASGGARINSDAQTLSITGGINGAAASTPLTVGGAGNTSVATVGIGANIGQLTKDGNGTLTLGVADSYTGGTVINAGTVAVTNATGLGATTVGVTVAGGAALNIGVAVTGQALTLNGGGSTTSATGPGTGGALRGTAASSWTGAITLASSSRINDDSGAMTLSGGINAASGSPTLTFGGTAGAAFTISGAIGSGIGAVVKDATSNVSFTVANAYTGGTTVLGGSIIGTAQASGSPFGSSTGPMTIDTATLRLNSIAATTTTTVGDFTVNPTSTSGSGAASLIVDNTTGGSGHTTTFAAGNLVRGGTGSVLVVTPVTNALGTGTGTGEVVTFTGGTTTTNGIMPSWVVAGSSTTGADFTSYGVNGLTTATTANAYTPGDLSTSTNSSVTNQTSPFTLNAPAATYALKTNQAINLSGNTLTIGNGTGTSGLILNTGGSITGGGVTGSTLTFGPTEGTVYAQSAATLGGAGDTVSSNGLDITVLSASALTLAGNITNATAPARLVVTAATAGSSVVLGGNNTYTGGTTLAVNGTINLNSDTAFGASTGKATIVLPAGTGSPTVQANGTRTIANPLDINIGLVFAGTNAMNFTGPVNVIQPQSNGSRTFNNSTAGLTVTFGSPVTPLTLTLGNPVANGGDGVGKTLILNAGTATSAFVVNDTIQDPALGAGGNLTAQGALGTFTFNGPLTFSGLFTISGTGTVNLNNATSTYSGGTLLSGSGTTIPLSASSNALPGPSFTAGPFGVGPITFNNGGNQHLRPTGAVTISNTLLLATGFAMDTNAGDTTSSLTFAGPIVMQSTGRFVSNGFSTGTSQGGTMILGAPTAPSTLTLPYIPNLTLSLAALWGPITINDVIQQPTGIPGNVSINPQTGNIFTITLNGANTYSGTTTIGGGTVGGGTVVLGSSSVGTPGAVTSGPFGTGPVVMNETASTAGAAVVPVLIPSGGDRTVANIITMTSGFQVANFAGTNYNLNLNGPISLTTAGRVLTNNMLGTLTLGAASGPSTINLGATTGQQLQFQGTGTTVVNDVIQNAANGTAGSILVTGGTVKFNAASTYSNGTSVTGGTLLVNNSTGTGTGTGTVTVTGSGSVGSGGTLGGGNSTATAGFISGSVTISTPTPGSPSNLQGGTLSPGNSAGTLTATGASVVTWNPVGSYLFQHDASATGTAPIGGSNNDLLLGTGTSQLNLNSLGTGAGQQFFINLSPLNTPGTPPTNPVTYTIADFSASTAATPISPPTGVTLNVPGLTDVTPYFSFTGVYQTTSIPTAQIFNGNQLQVTFTPVPEPAFVLAACGGLTAVGGWWVRRRRATAA